MAPMKLAIVNVPSFRGTLSSPVFTGVQTPDSTRCPCVPTHISLATQMDSDVPPKNAGCSKVIGMLQNRTESGRGLHVTTGRKLLKRQGIDAMSVPDGHLPVMSGELGGNCPEQATTPRRSNHLVAPSWPVSGNEFVASYTYRCEVCGPPADRNVGSR